MQHLPGKWGPEFDSWYPLPPNYLSQAWQCMRPAWDIWQDSGKKKKKKIFDIFTFFPIKNLAIVIILKYDNVKIQH